MRLVTRIADRLVGRVAPKANAEAACQAPPEFSCVNGKVVVTSGCPPYTSLTTNENC